MSQSEYICRLPKQLIGGMYDVLSNINKDRQNAVITRMDGGAWDIFYYCLMHTKKVGDNYTIYFRYTYVELAFAYENLSLGQIAAINDWLKSRVLPEFKFQIPEQIN